MIYYSELLNLVRNLYFTFYTKHILLLLVMVISQVTKSVLNLMYDLGIFV
jgi:hypothetical protein